MDSVNLESITIDDADSNADNVIIWDATAEMDYTIELTENIEIAGIPLSKYIKKEANMQYLTIGNVLLIIVVTVITVKFIIPRFNICCFQETIIYFYMI